MEGSMIGCVAKEPSKECKDQIAWCIDRLKKIVDLAIDEDENYAAAIGAISEIAHIARDNL